MLWIIFTAGSFALEEGVKGSKDRGDFDPPRAGLRVILLHVLPWLFS